MQVEHCENENVLEYGTSFMPSDEIPLTHNLFLFSCTSRPKLKLSYIGLGEHTLCRTNFDTVVLLRGGGVQKTYPETLKELKQTIGKGCYNIL
jgi:hypothetical protein